MPSPSYYENTTPGDCAGPDDLLLSDDTITTDEEHEACRTITLGPNLAVEHPGRLWLRAGERVTLTNGVSVGLGARLEIELDPSLI